MHKRSSNAKATNDANRHHKTAVNKTDSGDAEIDASSAAAILGRLGGLKGGKARAEKLTQKQRSAIAKKAAEARWHDHGDGSND